VRLPLARALSLARHPCTRTCMILSPARMPLRACRARSAAAASA
jgi:hypothetical protein